RQGRPIDPAQGPAGAGAPEEALSHLVHVVRGTMAEQFPLQRVEAAQGEGGEQRGADHPRSPRQATSDIAAAAAAPAASLPAFKRSHSSLLAGRDRESKSPCAPRSPGSGAARLSGRVSGSTGRSSICESQPFLAR